MRLIPRIKCVKNIYGLVKVRMGIKVTPARLPLHPKDSNARTFYWAIWLFRLKIYGAIYSRWLFKYWKGCDLLWLDKNHIPKNLWLEEDDQ